MKSVITKLAVLLMLEPVFATIGYAQSDNPVEQLKDCARMSDRDARIACYEQLGSRVLDAEHSDRSSTAEGNPNTSTLPDALGRAGHEKQQEEVQNTGLITSCKKGYDKQWYFYFDNGQVWKQVDNRPIRLKNCDFAATITRDSMGYRMQVPDKNRKIRIKRKE